MTEPGNRGLVPVQPHILLHDGRLFIKRCGDFTSLIEHCFSSALSHAIQSSTTTDSYRPSPVLWLNLELDPRLKNDVAVVVLPILNQRSCDQSSKEAVFLNSMLQAGKTMKPFVVEALPSTHEWRLNELLNLRLIVAVPWPDISNSMQTANIVTKRCATAYGGECQLIDLSLYLKRKIKVCVIFRKSLNQIINLKLTADIALGVIYSKYISGWNLSPNKAQRV